MQVTPSSTQAYNVIYTLGECSTQAQATVNVLNKPSVQLQNESICPGESATLVAIPSASGGTFIWSPGGETTPTLTVSPKQTSQYSVTYAIGQCESAPATSTVNVKSSPTADFIATPNVFSGYSETVQFINNSVGADSYTWDFGDGNASSTLNPSHFFQLIEEDGYKVTLYAINSVGCVDSFTVQIDQKELLIYYVPNTFTPEGNNVNDVFKPVFTTGFDPYNFRMLIFDRWGELIFETHNAEVGWDGTYGTGENAKICQDGTYTWKIDFRRADNFTNVTLTGHVNLLR
jgi:gliding motility-associated-like protein